MDTAHVEADADQAPEHEADHVDTKAEHVEPNAKHGKVQAGQVEAEDDTVEAEAEHIQADQPPVADAAMQHEANQQVEA